jgi:competence protein CoiA
MKFALVNDNKTEATKGAKGICPCCGSELVAKCGEVKINHWAHKTNRNCDLWWENETEWHRLWKNNFPVEWQEIVLLDKQMNEKHIADIRTSHGLVIEFQHSHIDPQERITRERFYQNMVWVVDGTRLKRDYPRFLKGKKVFRNTNNQGIFLVDFPEECFPSAWLGSSVPVIFDYRATESIDAFKNIRNHIYCLFPIRIGRYAILAEIPSKSFINTTINGEWLKRTQNFINKLSQDEKERLNQISKQQINNNIRRKESQYILERGRFIRRWRF